jgi:hypothetical protein
VLNLDILIGPCSEFERKGDSRPVFLAGNDHLFLRRVPKGIERFATDVTKENALVNDFAARRAALLTEKMLAEVFRRAGKLLSVCPAFTFSMLKAEAFKFLTAVEEDEAKRAFVGQEANLRSAE